MFQHRVDMRQTDFRTKLFLAGIAPAREFIGQLERLESS